MKSTLSLAMLLLCLATPMVWSAEALNFEDETTRINYSLGYQIGGDFKRQQVEMNAEAVVQGMRDALAGSEPQLSMPEMHSTLVELKKKVVETQEAQTEAQKAQKEQRKQDVLTGGKQFMQENAKKEGVVTTDSGLQYKVIREGTGAKPGPTDQVTVNYRAMTFDGKEFDSTYNKGKSATFRLDGVIKGWSEGLQLMKEGGKMQLYIPPELAYGHRGPLEHQTLIFDVELLSVGEPPKQSKAAE